MFRRNSTEIILINNIKYIAVDRPYWSLSMNILLHKESQRFIDDFACALTTHGTLKSGKARSHATEFLRQVIGLIHSFNNGNECDVKKPLYLELNKLREVKPYHDYKPMKWWSEQYCPLYKVVDLGAHYKKRNTEITLNYDIPLWQADIYIEDLKQVDTVDTPIDVDSLKHYKELLAIDAQSSLQVQSHLQTIQRVLDVAGHFDNVLPQRINEHYFGRQYLRGVNLQSSPREIRYAALGNHWEIDIEASAFAWRVFYVKNHNLDISTKITRRYIESKAEIRREVAHDVFGNTQKHSIDVIKGALTALSFGAKLNGTSTQYYCQHKQQWVKTSLITHFETIGRNSAYFLKRFANNEFVQLFNKESNSIKSAIYKYWKATDGQPNEHIQVDGEIKRGKLLAMLYQTHERQLLNAMTSCFAENNVLLRCHDGLYVRDLSDAEHLCVEQAIQSINLYARADFQQRNAVKKL